MLHVIGGGGVNTPSREQRKKVVCGEIEMKKKESTGFSLLVLVEQRKKKGKQRGKTFIIPFLPGSVES